MIEKTIKTITNATKTFMQNSTHIRVVNFQLDKTFIFEVTNAIDTVLRSAIICGKPHLKVRFTAKQIKYYNLHLKMLRTSENSNYTRIYF
jgi:hypothetical protein